MNEETKMLAHAIKSLADAHIGMGNVFREMVISSQETNRILGLIHDQNAHIVERLDGMNERHTQSEKAIRVAEQRASMLEHTQRSHAQHIARLETKAGIPASEQLGRSPALAR